MNNNNSTEIENIIKELFMTKIVKLNDSEDKDGKDKLYNQLIKSYPTKEKFVKKLFNEHKNMNNNFSEEIILDGIEHNNQTFYKDKNNRIWDENATLIGIINPENNKYMFFDDIK